MREEDTFAYQLFHSSFEVSMPQAFAYLNPVTEARGTYLSGDKALDREIAFSLVTTYRTLAQLIELVDLGAKLIFNRVEDIPRAYKILQGFLDEWARRMEINDIVSVITPEEKERLREAYKDIEKVEEFIQVMIPAVQRVKPAEKRSEGMTKLQMLLGITEEHLTTRRAEEASKLKSTPFEDRLTRGAQSRVRRWR